MSNQGADAYLAVPQQLGSKTMKLSKVEAFEPVSNAAAALGRRDEGLRRHNEDVEEFQRGGLNKKLALAISNAKQLSSSGKDSVRSE